MTPWRPAPLTRWHWLLPAALLAAGTAAVYLLDLDRRITRPFYDPAGPPFWPVGDGQPWAFIYQWGMFPALLLAGAGLILLAGGMARARPWPRWAGALILLSLLLGPLLVTNVALKDYWGRPRPRSVIEFGGERPFQPVLVPTFRDQEASFPGGHSAGGFSLLVLYFVLRGRRPGWAWGALGAAALLGSAATWARIAQGGHFFSDGLWAAGVDYFSAWAVAQGLSRWSAHRGPPRALSRRARAAIRGVAALLLAGLLLAYAGNLPIQRHLDWRVPLPPGTTSIYLELRAPTEYVHTVEVPGVADVRIYATLSGPGWPWAGLTGQGEVLGVESGELRLRYGARAVGVGESAVLAYEVFTPSGMELRGERIAP
jgi:membrane-associated PAP2 superfamily phosphatase